MCAPSPAQPGLLEEHLGRMPRKRGNDEMGSLGSVTQHTAVGGVPLLLVNSPSL